LCHPRLLSFGLSAAEALDAEFVELALSEYLAFARLAATSDEAMVCWSYAKPVKESLECLPAGASRSANLDRLQDDSFASSHGPTVKR